MTENISVGSTVCVASNPEIVMTVDSISQQDFGIGATCYWFYNGELRCGVFPLTVLKVRRIDYYQPFRNN